MMQSTVMEIKIPPRSLAFLRFVLEGFGHLALPVTLSGREGRVRFLISPGEEERFQRLLEDLLPWLR